MACAAGVEGLRRQVIDLNQSASISTGVAREGQVFLEVFCFQKIEGQVAAAMAVDDGAQAGRMRLPAHQADLPMAVDVAQRCSEAAA
jgi:hypothetical protein